MKQRTRAGSRNLFLLELVISILFFSLASAVCIQLFAESYSKSKSARQLSQAANASSTVAETVLSSQSGEELISLLRSIYPQGEISRTEAGFSLKSPLEDTRLTIKTDVRQTDRMLTAEISVEDEGGIEVYHLTVSHHLQRGNCNE